MRALYRCTVGMGDIQGGSAGWASTLLKPVLYNRHAETYMEVGLSLGHAMADLLMDNK